MQLPYPSINTGRRPARGLCNGTAMFESYHSSLAFFFKGKCCLGYRWGEVVWSQVIFKRNFHPDSERR